MADPRNDELVALAAELLIADDIVRDAEALGQAGHGAVSNGALWAYCRRADRGLLQLDLERAIRDNAGVRTRYCAMLGTRALASSPVAIAASDAAHVTRAVGDYRVAIVVDDGDEFLVVTAVGAPKRIPTSIEFVGSAGAARVDLSHMVRGHFQVPLSGDPSLAQIAPLMRDPTTQVFLL